jgi:hypothetical protein
LLGTLWHFQHFFCTYWHFLEILKEKNLVPFLVFRKFFEVVNTFFVFIKSYFCKFYHFRNLVNLIFGDFLV